MSKFWRYCYFRISGQFGAIPKPDFGRMVCKIYIFINGNPSSYKNWKLKTELKNF